jgi:hypothetical protein
VTLPAIFHDLAEEELNEAAAFYARARPGLGDAFLAEVHRAVDALVASCTAYATIIFVFSRLHIRGNGPSTGAVADDEATAWLPPFWN